MDVIITEVYETSESLGNLQTYYMVFLKIISTLFHKMGAKDSYAYFNEILLYRQW
jgi:hypothetical protein